MPHHQQGQSIEDAITVYVRAWASGIDRRKTLPGLSSRYLSGAAQLATKRSRPICGLLASRATRGPWNYPVIVAPEAIGNDLPGNHRVACIYMFTTRSCYRNIARLVYNRFCPDLFVSITDEKNRQLVIDEL